MKSTTNFLLILFLAQFFTHTPLDASDAGPAGAGSGATVVERLSFNSQEKCTQGQELLKAYLQALARSLDIMQIAPAASIKECNALIEAIKAVHTASSHAPSTKIIQTSLINNLDTYPFVAGYLLYKLKFIRKEIDCDTFFAGLDTFMQRHHKTLLASSASFTERTSNLTHYYKDLLKFYKNIYWQQCPLRDAPAGTEFKTFQVPLQLWSILLGCLANDLEDLVCIKTVTTSPTMPEVFTTESGISFFAPISTPPSKTVIEVLQEAITHYFKERQEFYKTPIATHIVNDLLPSLMAEMNCETFTSHLTKEQYALLCCSAEYQACAHILQNTKAVLSNIMRTGDEITLSDEELTIQIKNLIYALGTDILYCHLQDRLNNHEHRTMLRKLFSLNPDIPWHQEIVKPEEIPADVTDTVDLDSAAQHIVTMVKRWSLAHIIVFWRDTAKESTFTPKETLAMDTHITTVLMPKETYDFTDAQKASLLTYEKKTHQTTKIKEIKDQIKKHEKGHTSTLLTDLFHQLMTRYLLDVFDQPGIRLPIITAIRKRYVAKPLSKKRSNRHRRK